MCLTVPSVPPGPQTFSTRTQQTRNQNMRNPPSPSNMSLTRQVRAAHRCTVGRSFYLRLCPVSSTSATGGAVAVGVGGGGAQKQAVRVVAWAAGLTLIPPALLFTLEVLRLFRGDHQLSTQEKEKENHTEAANV